MGVKEKEEAFRILAVMATSDLETLGHYISTILWDRRLGEEEKNE